MDTFDFNEGNIARRKNAVCWLVVISFKIAFYSGKNVVCRTVFRRFLFYVFKTFNLFVP